MGAILLGVTCLFMAQVKNKAPQAYRTGVVSPTD